MKTLNTKPSYYLPDKANRVGGFELLPTQLLLPNITTQPIDGFSQNTWIGRTDPSYYDGLSTPTNNTINLLPGTEFSLAIGLSIDDPTTLNRYPYDIVVNLQPTFKWKKDDQYLPKYNSQNNGRGVQTLVVSAVDCGVDTSGTYMCEITNGYGTVETEPVVINVINVDTHPLLYKNLILNGDGNLDGWTSDFDIKTVAFVKDIYKSKNFGSYRLVDDYMILPTLDENNALIAETAKENPNFYFCIDGGYNLFPSILKKKGITNIAAGSIRLAELSSANDSDYLTAGPLLPQIIPNEDYDYNSGKSQYAGFFPGPYAIDNYNQNQNLIGLAREFSEAPNYYFTRDKIKFEKFGGSNVVKMSQTIDVAELADMIDGNVYGVSDVQGQFFAYIGAGITGYDVSYVDRKNRTNTLIGYGVTPEQLATALFDYEKYPTPRYNNLANLYLNTVDAAIKTRSSLDNLVNVIVKIYQNPEQFIEDLIAEEEDEEKKKDRRNKFIGNAIGIAVGVQAAIAGAVVGTFLGGNVGLVTGASTGTAIGLAVGEGITNILDKQDGSPQEPGIFEVEVIKYIKTFEPNYSGLIREMALDKFSGIQDAFTKRESANSDTNIEVTPRVDDQTEVVIEYLDAAGVILDNVVIDGPTAREVWAVKEKVYFPLTQFTIDNFLIKNNNKVTVFDQVYYKPATIKEIKELNSSRLSIMLRSKFDFGYGGAYPTIDTWWIAENKRYTHVIDRGAAAMFGVENTQTIPTGTRSIKITVYFKHLSGVDKDISPELKGWESQEIYDRDYKQDDLVSSQLSPYGNPRCGITKMKFTLSANSFKASSNYLSYFLPPQKDTVLGKALNGYLNSNYYNLDLKAEPLYQNIITPFNSGVPSVPQSNELNTVNVPPPTTALSQPPTTGINQSGTYGNIGIGGV